MIDKNNNSVASLNTTTVGSSTFRDSTVSTKETSNNFAVKNKSPLQKFKEFLSKVFEAIAEFNATNKEVNEGVTFRWVDALNRAIDNGSSQFEFGGKVFKINHSDQPEVQMTISVANETGDHTIAITPEDNIEAYSSDLVKLEDKATEIQTRKYCSEIEELKAGRANAATSEEKLAIDTQIFQIGLDIAKINSMPNVKFGFNNAKDVVEVINRDVPRSGQSRIVQDIDSNPDVADLKQLSDILPAINENSKDEDLAIYAANSQMFTSSESAVKLLDPMNLIKINKYVTVKEFAVQNTTDPQEIRVSLTTTFKNPESDNKLCAVEMLYVFDREKLRNLFLAANADKTSENPLKSSKITSAEIYDSTILEVEVADEF